MKSLRQNLNRKATLEREGNSPRSNVPLNDLKQAISPD